MNPAQDPDSTDLSLVRSISKADFSPWINLFERPAAPSQSDLDWGAEQLDKNTPLAPADQLRLKTIREAYIASRSDLPAPNRTDLEWAQSLEQRHQAGYQPDSDEIARLRDISVRFLIAQQRQIEEQLDTLPPATRPATEAERSWARERYLEAHAGEVPNPETVMQFMSILKACQAFGQSLS